MATGKHYRSGKTPDRQTRRSADDALYTYRPEAQPRPAAPQQPTPRQAPARPAPTQSPVRETKPAPRRKKKSNAAPILAVLLLLAAMGIVAYILWDMGFFAILLKLLG